MSAADSKEAEAVSAEFTGSDCKEADDAYTAPTLPAWLLSATAALDVTPAPSSSYLAGSYAGRSAFPPPSVATATPAAAGGGHPHEDIRGDASAARCASGPPDAAGPGATAAAAADGDQPVIMRSDDERAQRILSGFRIEQMSMRNGDTGRVLWTAQNLGADDLFARELEARLSADTLRAGSVTRSLTFSSVQLMRDFYMVQRVFLSGALLEEHEFTFGFVIPRSTNSWEQEIEADTENGTLPAEVLSGNLLVETQFFDKDIHVGSCVVRVFYDP